jgi:hypothetical protein
MLLARLAWRERQSALALACLTSRQRQSALALACLEWRQESLAPRVRLRAARSCTP